MCCKARATLFTAVLLLSFQSISYRCNGDEVGRPNIILVVCDDLGYSDVGFNAKQFNVDTDAQTSNLDALAKDGMVFTQAYVAHPFCGPSRMALFSGRMPHAFGGQKNLPDFSKGLKDYNKRGIPESEILLSSVLQQSGYRTACVGKWHLGYSRPFHPLSRGFDEFFGFLGGGHQYYPSVSDKVDPKINDYQYFLQRNWDDWKSPEESYLTDLLSDEAEGFIRRNSSGDHPFFLYLAYNAPHSPLQGKAEDLRELFPGVKRTQSRSSMTFRDYTARQNYVAMMHAVDRGIGQLKQALVDPNDDGSSDDSIMDHTLIVFLSDNGGKILQAGNNAPLLDDKGSTHEGGIRVPMFMHWPGHIAADSVFPHPVLALDLFPTFASLAGVKLPADKVLDGKDIWSCIGSGESPHQNETLFWLRHHGAGNEVAIRRNELKAYRKNYGKWEVFDLQKDVGEQTNIMAKNQDFLSLRIDEGANWAKNHLQPLWHDTEASFETWHEKSMPKYDETFKLR